MAFFVWKVPIWGAALAVYGGQVLAQAGYALPGTSRLAAFIRS